VTPKRGKVFVEGLLVLENAHPHLSPLPARERKKKNVVDYDEHYS
jgi:hypothetical protein